MDDTKLFSDYALVRAQIASLEVREGELKKQIVEKLALAGKKTVENPYGKFTTSVKKNWIYSPKITKMEEEVKIAKFHEQEQDIAVLKETKYLSFTPHG